MALMTTYVSISPYVTKDGSVIRELMHPGVHGNQHASMAEACISPGKKTALHVHTLSEEIYHITQGIGQMTLGDEQFMVAAGDTICIKPGEPHCIENMGDKDLTIICSCAPPYSHQDTDLLGE